MSESPTGQAVSSTSSSGFDVQSTLESALAVYSRTTGIDLSRNRFAAGTRISQAESPDGILQLLQERLQAFKEFRNDNQGLTNTLNPVVRVLHALSRNLGEAVDTVSHTCYLVSLLFNANVVRSPFHQQVLYLLGSILSLPYVP